MRDPRARPPEAPPLTDSTGTGVSGRPGGFRRGLGLILRLVVTGLVSWFILRAVGLNLGALRAFDLASVQFRWGLFALSVATLLLAYLYAAGLWGLMVRELGGPEVPTVAALRVFFTANLGRYLPGKIWQLAGLAYLSKGEGVSASTATAAALLGQLFSLAGATLVGLGVLLESEWGRTFGGPWMAGIILALLVVLTFPAILRPLLAKAMTRVQGEVNQGVPWPDGAFGVRWLGLYAVAWILQGGAFWILVMSMGWVLRPVQGVAIFPAAYLLGYVALFAPAGVGVREATLIAFLNPMLGAGGAVVAVVARLWTTAVELIPALALAGGYVRKENLHQDDGGAGG